MVKPVDLEESLREHFKEQKERMDISDEDWGEYEERMYKERRKRKRAEREELKAKNKHPGLGKPAQEATSEQDNLTTEHDAPPDKKRKVSQHKADSPPPPQNESRPLSPQNRMPPPLSPISHAKVTASSNLRKAASGPSTKLLKLVPRAPVHIAPTNPSSNVSTPCATPIKAAATISALPPIASGSGSSETAAHRTKGKANTRSKSLLDPHGRASTRKASTEAKERAQAERLSKKAAQKAKREVEMAKKAQDHKEALMTPLEYAAILQEKWKARITSTSPEKLFLKDKVVFLVFEEQNKSSKDTRIKLDIIAKNGGKVALKYDPQVVTHIISGGSSISLKKTLRALELKSLSEIPPGIKTVKWDWIVSGLSRSNPDSEIMHEAFKQRMAYMFPTRSRGDDAKGKGKGKSISFTNEHSIIEDFNSVYDSPNEEEDDSHLQSVLTKSTTARSVEQSKSVTATSGVSSYEEDPLLPFYAKAREEADAEDSSDKGHKPPSNLMGNHPASNYKGFQCDKKGMHLRGTSPNWDIIEKLAELREMHRDFGTKDDMWRVIGYQKAIGSLKSHPTRIKCHDEAVKLAGVSDKTADKIMEIIKTGELRRIDYTKTADLTAMRLFGGIYGVGSSTARKWYNQGLKSLEDVRRAVQEGKHKLSLAQEIGLRYYDDINDRMPRSEAQDIFKKVKPVALCIDPKLSLEIMGSFRRGKETCGDIDILLTRPTDDGKTHAGILPRLCNQLHKQGIITEDLALPDDWGALEATYRGLCRKDTISTHRRIDILCIPYESRGAARLYYTGDDIFNRSIRLKANKMDMSLNQRGLFQGVVRDPQDRRKKLCPGTLLCSDSEEKIFEILGVPWQEPHERVRGG